MSRFRDELKIIPVPAWIIAVASFALTAILFFSVVIPQDRQLRRWPFPGALAFSLGCAAFILAYVLLIGYINGDAKRRGMRRVLWTFIAIFVPNAIGILLYFFMREPMLSSCSCGARVRSTFAYCPSCGTQLRRACPSCRYRVEPGWKSCAYCGASLTEPASPGSHSFSS